MPSPSSVSTNPTRTDKNANGHSIELSIVIPVYRCAPSLQPLYVRLTKVLEKLAVDYEIVFVDDASPDHARLEIERLSASHAPVRGLFLDRNSGQHSAIATGIDAAVGAHVAVMDGDLQDPPEELPRLYRSALAGYDVVVGRPIRPHQSRWRTFGSRAFFLLLGPLYRGRLAGTCSLFSVISREVADRYSKVPERNAMYLPIVEACARRIQILDYEKLRRPQGRSS